ncbi:MAG: hypothetical protein ACI9P5_004735 [Saprospiraceae bacterium]|jgi:hypothetical protein
MPDFDKSLWKDVFSKEFKEVFSFDGFDLNNPIVKILATVII